MNGYSLHKEHNAEDVRLKARPVGRCPKASPCVIVFYHATSMLSKQCLDPDFWASPEFMIHIRAALNIILISYVHGWKVCRGAIDGKERLAENLYAIF
jgi:hypothetical protein